MSTRSARTDSRDAQIISRSAAGRGRPEVEPLWRNVLGHQLRRIRREQSLTLEATARRAGVSPQYLSEIERGVKEPSSEMIAAVSGALGLSLSELILDIGESLAPSGGAPSRAATDHLSGYLLAA